LSDRSDDKNFWNFLKWRWQRLFKNLPPASAYDFPAGHHDPHFLQNNRSRPTATWIGQAPLLIQLGGLNLLTDPHFSSRASPVAWWGPQRVVPPGLALADLPNIDLVLISHNHYDHLDESSIRRLLQRPEGPQIRFVVPPGIAKLLIRWGAQRVTELAWWENLPIDRAEVTAVPVQHWSRRGLSDHCESGWAGFLVAAGGLRLLFVGDSGYADVFRQVRRRLGAVDIAALPIGAYEPRWFMRDHHMNPEEAVQAHLDLGADLSLALHWGTFILTDEPLDEPPQRLAAALRAQGIPAQRFPVLRHGETLLLDEELKPQSRPGRVPIS